MNTVYKIEDARGYPICFGDTQREAITKAQEWTQTYPHLTRLPLRLIKIEEKFIKKL